MTASTNGFNSKWTVYTQERYRKMLAHITGKPCTIEVVKGYGAAYNERLLRAAIEKATGKKFVFGFDPTDRSMVEGKENTYGWFLSNIDIVMEWTTEVHDDYEVECDDDEGNSHRHTHEVTVTTDPFGFTSMEWECDEFGASCASTLIGFTREGASV